MEYMGTRTASEKWGYSQATITDWCRQNLIKGAEQDSKGRPWRIPVNAECPKQERRK